MSAHQLDLYLGMLFGAEPEGAFAEIRHRLPEGGMGREFHPVRDRPRMRDRILELGASVDTYLGVLARVRRSGTRDDVARSHVGWADLDDPDAHGRLGDFASPPSMIISSGRGLHAYWALSPPLDAAHLTSANRRIAYALGADLAATDPPRILRPPGTFNYKHDDRRPVEVVESNLDALYTAAEIVSELPDPPDDRPRRVASLPTGRESTMDVISPLDYVPALTGLEPDRSGKVACPFHNDRTPSLQLYEDADRGWVCFAGCGGGTIYDFAALLWKIEPRGAGFHELRRRLAQELLRAAA